MVGVVGQSKDRAKRNLHLPQIPIRLLITQQAYTAPFWRNAHLLQTDGQKDEYLYRRQKLQVIKYTVMHEKCKLR